MIVCKFHVSFIIYNDLLVITQLSENIMRILIVEDDKMLGDAIRQGLIQEGYAADQAQYISDADLSLLTQHYDFIILDIGLPDGSGLDFLHNIRKRACKIPVLILTAHDTTEDKIAGLDAGADDYMIKPFDMDELCARIRSLHRRSVEKPFPVITYKDITLHTASHSATLHNTPIEIGTKEFIILQTLIENAGRILSKQELEDTLYSWDDNISSNTIEVHIHRIRKKFGNNIIKNIRGVGYIVETTD